MPSLTFTDRWLQSVKVSTAQVEFFDQAFTARGAFILVVSPRGMKTFYHRYATQGQRKRLKLGKYPAMSLSEARTKAYENADKLEAGEDPAIEPTVEKALTFSDLALLFFDRYVSCRCKPSTQRAYKYMLSNELVPLWGEREITHIKRRDVIAVLDTVANGRGSPVMANRIRAAISKMYNFAISRDLAETNPVVGTERPGKERRGERVLSTKEIKQLWLLLEKEHPIMRGIYRLLLLTGQRPGEVASMRWRDIDGDIWTITGEVSKNGRAHRIHLSAQALQVVEDVRSNTEPNEFVFSYDKQHPVVFIRRASRRLNRNMLEEEMKLENGGLAKLRDASEMMQKWNPRDIRRTVQTRMAELGIRPDIVDRVLNHNVRGVRAHYDHYNYYPEIRNALILWADRVSQIVNAQDVSKVIALFG